MQHQPLLAGHDLDPVHAGIEIAHPEAGPAQHRRHEPDEGLGIVRRDLQGAGLSVGAMPTGQAASRR